MDILLGNRTLPKTTREQSLQDRVQELERKLAEAQAALKQTQDELELSRLHLGAILKAVPAGVWIADRQGRVLIKSGMVDEIWGAGAPLPDSIEKYGAYRGWWADTGQLIQPEEWTMARALRLRRWRLKSG